MPKKTHAQTYLRRGPENNSRSMVLYFGISLLVHLIFIGAVVLLPDMAPKRRLRPGAINVNLVSLPGPRAAQQATGSAAKAAPVAKPAEIKKPKAPVMKTRAPKPSSVAVKPQKQVSLAPEKKTRKVKKSLKKKTLDRQKMIRTAVSGVKKNVEKARTDSVKQALERIKKKVEQTETSRPAAGGKAAGATGAAAEGGGGGGGGKRTLELIDIYKVEVAFQVERHWAFSQQLGGDNRELETRMVFKVLPNGKITDIRFTRRSGNRYLDESAYKAIIKANPVSPHPAGVRKPYVIVALRFTPEGLRK